MSDNASRPQLRAIDLYCGAGGVAIGLQQAGFDVTGIDIEPQPDYPGRFVQMDVLELTPEFLRIYHFVWASPPCQHDSVIRRWSSAKRPAPNLVPQTQKLLAQHPYTVIEQTRPGQLTAPIILELAMFRDKPGNHRRRYFQCSYPTLSPGKPSRKEYGPCIAALTGDGRYYGREKHLLLSRRAALGLPFTTSPEEAAKTLGVEHIVSGPYQERRRRINNALPPEYSRYLASQAREQMASHRLLPTANNGSQPTASLDHAHPTKETIKEIYYGTDDQPETGHPNSNGSHGQPGPGSSGIPTAEKQTPDHRRRVRHPARR